MFLFTRNWRGLKNILFHFVANHVESSFTHFFASAFDASFSRSSSWRFLASSLTFIMESRQQANMSSMIAAAGVDTLENARCDRRALRAEHVPVGQSRSTLGGSTLSSRHAHVFVFARERSRDRERHPRRPPKIAQLVHRYDASFCLLAEPVHFTLSLGRRTTAQPLSRSRRTEFHARNLRRRRRRADGGGGGAVGAPPALPRRRLRRHRVAATPARRRARRPFASRRRSRRERSRHVPFARSLARASRHRVSIRVTRGRTAAGSDASRHTPPRRVRW